MEEKTGFAPRLNGFSAAVNRCARGPLDLNSLLVRNPPSTFFARMSGDSMEGAGICDGDLLVIDRSLSPKDGDIVVAFVDGEFVARRFRRAAGGAVSASVAFSRPTDDTSEMIKAVFPKLREIFIEGRRYKKSGVTLWGLESGAAQGELFGPSPERSRLYSSVDEVNRKFGRGTLFPLAEGVDKKWNARRDMLSRAYTTSWDDIISVV